MKFVLYNCCFVTIVFFYYDKLLFWRKLRRSTAQAQIYESIKLLYSIIPHWLVTDYSNTVYLKILNSNINQERKAL